MKRVLSILWTAAALAVAPSAALAQQQGVTADTVTIGAFGPITGPAAYIGLAGRDGIDARLGGVPVKLLRRGELIARVHD